MDDVARLKRENRENERNAIEKLLADDDFTDVTLVSKDGSQVGAHRAVLGNASTFLRSLLLESQHQNTFLYLGMVADRQVLFLYVCAFVLLFALSLYLICLYIAFVNQSRLFLLTFNDKVLQALVNFVYLSHCTLHMVVSISLATAYIFLT